jgi:Fe-S oxidoreductase
MSSNADSSREGSLDAPTRHPLNWKDEQFHNEQDLYQELERVFDICHGCRRCFSLCNAFPTLFDLVDESETMEVDGVPKGKYMDVVDQCYLCDMCFMTKCPYVPPHPWNVDFPHLMLRAKAFKYKGGGFKARDRILSSTDAVGKLAGIPVVAEVVNTVNQSKAGRVLLEKTLGVHRDAHVPRYHSKTLRKTAQTGFEGEAVEAGPTRGRVALFSTCYINYNEPRIGLDLIKVFEHNEIPVTLAGKEQCCGMPKLELGDLEAVARATEANVPVLAELVDQGFDIVAPVPSCVLMFKQELPLMYPQDPDVQKVKASMFDPFEYLMHRQKAGLLKTDFKSGLGRIAYHLACHLRVQNIGMKTRELLSLIPDTEIEAIERCSGHDGTYGVKKESHETSIKIGKPVMNRVNRAQADYYSSDCPMAGYQISLGVESGPDGAHPMSLLRKAYGI